MKRLAAPFPIWHAFDVGAESSQFLFQPLVSAVEMGDLPDNRLAAGRQSLHNDVVPGSRFGELPRLYLLINDSGAAGRTVNLSEKVRKRRLPYFFKWMNFGTLCITVDCLFAKNTADVFFVHTDFTLI